MKKRIFPYLAAILAAAANGGGNITSEIHVVPVLNPVVTTQVNPTNFGLYQANKRTHKKYLRAHHLGKFAKKKR